MELAPWLQALPYVIFITIVAVGGALAWFFTTR
jgi:hypothetical protein